MKVNTSFEADAVRIALVGELDLANAPFLADYLLSLRRRGRRVILDLSRVDFIDSAGARAIMPSDRTRDDWLQIDRGLSTPADLLLSPSEPTDAVAAA